jgi:Na+/H+ antiporter NhaD/arsenite permease-like protein
MKKNITLLFLLVLLQSLCQPLFAAEPGGVSKTILTTLELNGATLSALWALPFLGMILSIAIFPLVLPKFWGKHYGKVSFIWSVIVLVGIAATQGVGVSFHSLILVMFEQFLPFIFLLLSLFTITGGIKLRGELIGNPHINTLILLIGAILSSWLGTTGAAVLLIRPLISANAWRTYKVHTIVFFTFIVANIGGSLTPVGNPPLLMGFISKVPFFWPLSKLLAPTALACGILLLVYFIMDNYFYNKETKRPIHKTKKVLKIEGGWNFLLLVAVIFSVLASSQDWGIAFYLYHVPMPLSELVEILAMLAITIISLKITRKITREANLFSWHPIMEVGKIFAAIFICMAPLIAMLRAGTDGPMKFIIASLSANGHPINGMYYWLSGGLSAFLDSAPAYLVFFNTAAAPAAAAGMPPHVFMTGVLPATLIAITAGASFMGAITYIGNAPNMMIKAIAEEDGIKMPSFFGYMLWSVIILVPLFILIQFLFIG